MHYNAKQRKHGLATAGCLSVTLVDQDHIGWKS